MERFEGKRVLKVVVKGEGYDLVVFQLALQAYWNEKSMIEMTITL